MASKLDGATYRGSGAPKMDEASRKQKARSHLDAAEAWLRRLTELKLAAALGSTYLKPDPEGSATIGSRLRRNAWTRFHAEPQRFPRLIDATDFDDLIKIILLDAHYKPHFQAALDDAYAESRDLARAFLKRLVSLRNKLAHGGTCSERDLEQAVCYSNDLIDSIKGHLRSIGMTQQFNVPRFQRVVDNRGNDFHLTPGPNASGQFINVIERGNGELQVGDTLEIEAEVDPSFEEFTVRWMTFNGDKGNFPLRLFITPKHVGLTMDVRLEVISREPWHRLHNGIDDMVDLRYRVLPPVT